MLLSHSQSVTSARDTHSTVLYSLSLALEFAYSLILRQYQSSTLSLVSLVLTAWPSREANIDSNEDQNEHRTIDRIAKTNNSHSTIYYYQLRYPVTLIKHDRNHHNHNSTAWELGEIHKMRKKGTACLLLCSETDHKFGGFRLIWGINRIRNFQCVFSVFWLEMCLEDSASHNK
jgi:hypothetical protein